MKVKHTLITALALLTLAACSTETTEDTSESTIGISGLNVINGELFESAHKIGDYYLEWAEDSEEEFTANLIPTELLMGHEISLATDETNRKIQFCLTDKTNGRWLRYQVNAPAPGQDSGGSMGSEEQGGPKKECVIEF